MKVLKLKKNRQEATAATFISEALKRDWDAFKATSKQFIRNNKMYCDFTGLIA